MRHAYLCLALCGLFATDSRSAPVKGDRVRIHGAGSAIVGEFSGMVGDTVVLKTVAGSQEIPRDRITGVEISVGRKGNALSGMLIGTGVGVVTGLMVDAGGDDSSTSSIGDRVADEMFGTAGILLLGVIGAGVGALIGHFVKTDQWAESSLAMPSIGLVPGDSGRIQLVAGWTVRF